MAGHRSADADKHGTDVKEPMEARVINDKEHPLSKEALDKAGTLISKSSSTEQKLKAAEELGKMGFPDIKIQDTDGVRDIHIDAKDLGSNRTEIEVMSGNRPVLRAIDDNGQMKHQMQSGKEVGFYGDRFSKLHPDSALVEHDQAAQKPAASQTKPAPAEGTKPGTAPAEGTKPGTAPAEGTKPGAAPVEGTKPGTATAPLEGTKPAPAPESGEIEFPRKRPEDMDPMHYLPEKPFSERISVQGLDAAHPRTIMIERAPSKAGAASGAEAGGDSDEPPLVLRRSAGAGPDIYRGTDGNRYKVELNRHEGTMKATILGADGVEGNSTTWLNDGREIDVEKNGRYETSTFKNADGSSETKVIKCDGKVSELTVPGVDGQPVKIESHLGLHGYYLADSAGNQYRARVLRDGTVKCVKLNSDGDPIEETRIHPDGKIDRKDCD